MLERNKDTRLRCNCNLLSDGAVVELDTSGEMAAEDKLELAEADCISIYFVDDGIETGITVELGVASHDVACTSPVHSGLIIDVNDFADLHLQGWVILCNILSKSNIEVALSCLEVALQLGVVVHCMIKPELEILCCRLVADSLLNDGLDLGFTNLKPQPAGPAGSSSPHLTTKCHHLHPTRFQSLHRILRDRVQIMPTEPQALKNRPLTDNRLIELPWPDVPKNKCAEVGGDVTRRQRAVG
ncbi:hypothetical protein GGX14DRAFT_406916 [Mycena pura]|uniref:Uncharacterized protein n=1 Tax=Mycena pura TaxID=153505 RepID=A0AAD6UT86_9AGAR|nr:hypothetical protein GGX14DRAFT_406916 [Mycena pura]